MAGSEKRIKELRNAFNSPERYGKGLDWTGYTVHDAANILRRYFNQLPEPIIPLQYYEQFREPLRNHQSQAVGSMDHQAPPVGKFDHSAAIKRYQQLITEIPPLNRQLLLYILDLLAVFASKSETNKMTTPNLAAIFQPGLLSHPSHDMAPQEYRLSQDVLIFLIENQDHFLIGMQGTAADEKTLKEVASGPPTPHGKSSGKSSLGRSASNGSAAADSVRKYGGVRRNLSTSSRHSKASIASPSPVTPSFQGAGVHRSNTVPSKKSPAIAASRFPKETLLDPEKSASVTQDTINVPRLKTVQQQQTSPEAPKSTGPLAPPNLAVPEVISPSSEEATPLGGPPSMFGPASPSPAGQGKPLPQDSGHGASLATRNRLEGTGERSPAALSPSEQGAGARSFLDLFGRSPSQDAERRDGRKPNKLQKKRAPGSGNPSAHSSTHSLTGHVGGTQPASPPPSGAAPPAYSQYGEQTQVLAPHATPQKPENSENLKIGMSPSTSMRSHSTATEHSEADHGDETPVPAEVGSPEKHDRRSRWKFPHRREAEPNRPGDTSVGTIAGAEKSVNSVTSESRGRTSSGADRHARPSESSNNPLSPGEQNNGSASKEAEKKDKSARSWLSRKMQERKDREVEKQRAKSPDNKHDATLSKQSLSQTLPPEVVPPRGKSLEIRRATENRGPNSESAAAGEIEGQASAGPAPIASAVPPAPSTEVQAHPAATTAAVPAGAPAALGIDSASAPVTTTSIAPQPEAPKLGPSEGQSTTNASAIESSTEPTSAPTNEAGAANGQSIPEHVAANLTPSAPSAAAEQARPKD